jgi:hypothetical protein
VAAQDVVIIVVMDVIAMSIAEACAANDSSGALRRVSIDGLMGLDGIVGGELSSWQLENMAPFLHEPRAALAVATKRERIPRTVARERAVKVAAKREKAQEKKERKRVERKEKKNPSLTATAVFKRRKWELAPGPRGFKEFIIQLRQEQQPVLDLETTLQGLQVGQTPQQTPPQQLAPKAGNTCVSKTARRKVNTAVNEMSGLFAVCCQLSPEARQVEC